MKQWILETLAIFSVWTFPGKASALPPLNLMKFKHVLAASLFFSDSPVDLLVCETFQIRCQPFHLSYTHSVTSSMFIHVGSQDGLALGGRASRNPWSLSGGVHLHPKGISFGLGYAFPGQWGITLRGMWMYGALAYQDGSMLSQGQGWSVELLVSWIPSGSPLALFMETGIFQHVVQLDIGALNGHVLYWQGGLAYVR